MPNNRTQLALLTLTIASVLLGACTPPAAPAPTATAPPPPTATVPPPTATAPPPPTSTATSLPAAATPTAGIPVWAFPEIPRVSLEDAKAALDAGTALFIDVRAAPLYETSHIKGAINIWFEDIEQRMGELDKAQWIITYSTRPLEERSAGVAHVLLEAGFRKVTALQGGFNAWTNAGLPVEP